MTAAVYVQFFHFSGRLLYKTGFYTRQASIQDRLLYKTGLWAAVVQLLAAYTVQSMHAESQRCVFYT